MTSRRALVAGSLLFTGFTPLDAQVVQSTAADPTCRCRIELERVVVLGADDQELAIAVGSRLSRDSRGRFLVAPSHSMGVVAVFDSAGRPLPSVGTPGQGPGELRQLRHALVLPGDSILVYDDRFSLFAPDGRFVRSGPSTSPVDGFQFAALSDGRAILNNYIPTRAAFVQYGNDFRQIREFGARTPERSPGDSYEILYNLLGLPDGRLVAVRHMYRFGIEIWDSTGKLLRRHDRDPRWFPRYTGADVRRAGQVFGSPAQPRVKGARVDEAQRLWTLTGVPDPRWPEPRNARIAAPGSENTAWRPIPIADYMRWTDSVIEVSDLETGAVRITQRFDINLSGFTDDGLIYGIRELDSGLIVLDVYRHRIVPAP